MVREQKELSEKMGMLLFEREVLHEKINGEIQLRIKLKALMNIRATQFPKISELPLHRSIRTSMVLLRSKVN